MEAKKIMALYPSSFQKRTPVWKNQVASRSSSGSMGVVIQPHFVSVVLMTPLPGEKKIKKTEKTMTQLMKFGRVVARV
jgi:hypothetical protein